MDRTRRAQRPPLRSNLRPRRFAGCALVVLIAGGGGCGRYGFDGVANRDAAAEDAAAEDAPASACAEWVENGDFDDSPTWSGDTVEVTHDAERGLMAVRALGFGATATYRIDDPEAFAPSMSYVYSADLGCDEPPQGDLEIEVRVYNQADERVTLGESLIDLTCGVMTPHEVLFDPFPEPFPGGEIVYMKLRLDWAGGSDPTPSGTLLVDNASYHCLRP